MVSCLMGDSTALASAIVRCCLKELYLLTLKAYKNPSEQIKQLHEELNKL